VVTIATVFQFSQDQSEVVKTAESIESRLTFYNLRVAMVIVSAGIVR